MNLSPEEIAQAIAEVLESAEGYGIVVTDKRFAESNGDLSRLLKGQADNSEWRGWVMTWAGIASQVDDGPCDKIITYRFALEFVHFYENDSAGEISSEISFKRALFNANEALNESRDLGLGARIHHLGLESADDFLIVDIDGGSVSEKCHIALFLLSVEALNHYED
jgi:hypothetical protein